MPVRNGASSSVSMATTYNKLVMTILAILTKLRFTLRNIVVFERMRACVLVKILVVYSL